VPRPNDVQGHCHKGERCPYAHSDAADPRAPPCQDFMRGYCPRRAACPFPHFSQSQMVHYQHRPQEFERLLARHLDAKARSAASAVRCAASSGGDAAIDGCDRLLEQFSEGPPCAQAHAGERLPRLPAAFEGMADARVPGSDPPLFHIGGILIDAAGYGA
jgi:hypothetical protein